MRPAPILAAALLLAPLALGQTGPATMWDQFGGDAARSRLAALPAGPLDVIATGRVMQGLETVGLGDTPVALQTEEGMVMLAGPRRVQDRALEPCVMLRVEPRTLATERLWEAPCPYGASLLGLHRDAGLVLTCWRGGPGEVEVRAYDERTLEERWRARPPPDPASGAPAITNVNDRWCTAVIEQDRFVVAFSDNAQNAIVALDLEGRPIWTTRAPTTGPRAGHVMGMSVGVADPTGLVGIYSITRTSGGYVLWGSADSRLTWLDNEGRYVSGLPTSLIVPGREPYFPTWTDLSPVAQADQAIAVVGGVLVQFRATDQIPQEQALRQATAPGPLLWWREQIVHPSFYGFTTLHTASLDEPRDWKSPMDRIDDMLVTPEGQIVALSTTQDTRGLLWNVSWVDLATHAETGRMPLPLHDMASGLCNQGCGGRIVPVAGVGLMVIVHDGVVTTLGKAAAPIPEAVVSTSYPRVGETLTLATGLPQGATGLQVAWGDGVVEMVSPPSASHVYVAPGARTISITALYGDGRTATTQKSIDVDGEPPMRLSAIQRAFSPENQELTFFLIGLALTGGGALFAALLRRQRHSRLAEEERKLRAVIDASLLEPTRGLAALEAHRAHLRDQHTRRRLDDAQYGLLDARAVRAMKSARYRLLGPALNKLTAHFRRLLDTALEDGQVTPGEMAALVAALDDERALEDAERERLRGLLTRWAR